MRALLKIVMVLGALAIAATPAFAGQPENVPPPNPGAEHSASGGPEYNPAPPNLPPQAKAYGVYCQKESKKHVAGEPGTPFSQCVKRMARAAHHPGLTPREACKGLSKKHVKGQKRTPFAECVVAAAHLRHDEHQQAQS